MSKYQEIWPNTAVASLARRLCSDFYRIMQGVSSSLPDAGKIDEYLSAANFFLSEAEGEGTSAEDGAQHYAAPHPSYLFEGQLTEVQFQPSNK